MSRLMNAEKFNEVVVLVQETLGINEAVIADFVDGGDEGWDCGDEEQKEWLESESVENIASWVIAGQ